MRFEALSSSSAGNAYIVSDRDTRILLECGIPASKIRKRSGLSLSEFQACLVSHEHKDHAKSAADLIGSGVEVFMSQGTAEALELEAVTVIESMVQFNIGTLDVVPFATFHDAQEPLGFLIRSRVDEDVLAFATDTVNLNYRFPGLNILAVEANFDAERLNWMEKMPEKVRRRIANTHMDIDVLCRYISRLDLSRCREIHLLHLSKSTSHEGHFINKVARIVPKTVQVFASLQ